MLVRIACQFQSKKLGVYSVSQAPSELATRAGLSNASVTLPQVIVRVAKIENKIVAVAAREGLTVIFESAVERETQDAFVCPRRRENILVLRERK